MNKDKTFDTFIEGDSSLFAYVASRTAAEARAFNPLWLFAPSGCGKTHLISAICNLATDNGKRALYITAGDISTRLIAAVKGDKTALSVFDGADVIAIDNAESIRGADMTQHAIAMMIKEFVEKYKLVVIASNCPPAELKTLYEGIKDIDNALVADIQPPTYRERRAYADRFINKYGVNITDDGAEYLARRLDRMPAIEGALQTARLWSEQNKKPVTAAWIRRYINDCLR